MNKFLFFIILSIPSTLCKAQTMQSGIVMEYNEKNQKTVLPGVEIVISNAGATTSGTDGKFKLSFRTLKPGDKVLYKRIEKLGYELFNTEALSQWYISRNDVPFTIIMCRSDKFKRIRDNYFRISSQSYAKQYKKEQEELAKRRKKGELQKEQYKMELIALKNSYEQQLENLDSYIDHFARIDLSSLSETEQKIIALVQQGKIEEAISEYEQQDYLAQYKRLTDNIRNIDKALSKIDDLLGYKIESIDSLRKVVETQIELYIQKGDESSLQKASKLKQAMSDVNELLKNEE